MKFTRYIIYIRNLKSIFPFSSSVPYSFSYSDLRCYVKSGSLSTCYLSTCSVGKEKSRNWSTRDFFTVELNLNMRDLFIRKVREISRSHFIKDKITVLKVYALRAKRSNYWSWTTNRSSLLISFELSAKWKAY